MTLSKSGFGLLESPRSGILVGVELLGLVAILVYPKANPCQLRGKSRYHFRTSLDFASDMERFWKVGRPSSDRAMSQIRALIFYRF